MKPDSTDQDELQRILALKRQERPPQKFFRGLSTAVIDRIQHPEPPPPPTLWQRLGLDFDSKPVLVCVLGVAVCGLLAYAVISSRNVKAPPPGPESEAAAPHLTVSSNPGPMGSSPPLKAPGDPAEDLPRAGEPVKNNHSPASPRGLGPRPSLPAPVPDGK